MPLANWSVPDYTFASDACLVGCGGVAGNEYFHSSFPEFITSQELHINALELLSIVVCLKIWGNRWKGLRILIYCDNLVSVTVINSGRTRDSFLQNCLREICFLCASFECQVRAIHLPGVDNRFPDMLSRWDLDPSIASVFPSMFQGLERFVDPNLFSFSHSW